MDGEGLFPGTVSKDIVPGGGLTGELLPLGTGPLSALCRGQMGLDSAVVHSVGVRAGEGEILRTLASSLGGERSEADVVRFFFLCLILSSFWKKTRS